MFKLLKRKYRLHRFRVKWQYKAYPYRDPGYFYDIKDIIESFTDYEILGQYTPRLVISSAYPCIEHWVDACREAITTVKNNQSYKSSTRVDNDIDLRSYLITKDDYSVTYLSALRTTMDLLGLLYQAISTLDNTGDRDYYYRQTEHLLITGITLLTTVINDT